MSEGRGQELGQLVLILSLDQLIDQARSVVETHPVTLTASCQRQAGSDVRFPQTGIADQDDRPSLAQILATSQFQHPLLVQSRHAGKVKGRGR